MANNNESKAKVKWLYTAKAVKKKLKSHSTSYWVKQCLIYLDDMREKGRVPMLTSFYKSIGCWVFYLRDDLAKGHYKTDTDMLDKYNLIKKIIKDGFKEDIINRNADTATFGIALLQNEEDWDQRQKTDQPTAMTITFVNYSLPPAEAPAELPDIIDADIIDADVIQPVPEDEQPLPLPGPGPGDEQPGPEDEDDWDMFAPHSSEKDA